MKKLFFIFLGLVNLCIANPFLIDFPDKELLTAEDYFIVQNKLKEKNLDPFIERYYPKVRLHLTQKKKFGLFEEKSDFANRMSRGIKQTLIEDGKNPISELVKIGNGGDRCIVSCVPLNEKYIALIENCKRALKEAGFNGYFYYRIGGFPNPTGREIRYAGVPYCFKVFLMLEAEKLGFQKVLWVDSALEPLQDLSPLFAEIEKTGSFLVKDPPSSKAILPIARKTLVLETGIDPVKVNFIRAQVFGLDFSRLHVQEFVQEYYKMVELGTPFCSCFPEEFVCSSLVGKNPSLWHFRPVGEIVGGSTHSSFRKKGKSGLKQKGYFFFMQPH